MSDTVFPSKWVCQDCRFIAVDYTAAKRHQEMWGHTLEVDE